MIVYGYNNTTFFSKLAFLFGETYSFTILWVVTPPLATLICAK